jgi:hypothetical protein
VGRFTQKLGPLPVWAWAIIGVLAIVGYMYFTKTGFFGSGSVGSNAATPKSNALSDLLGAGGGGGAATGAAAAAAAAGTDPAPAFGPTVINYDNSTAAGSGPDRGGSVAPPTAPPTYPGQLGTVAAFAPIQNYLGHLLPGILTPARVVQPYSLSAPTPSASGRSL